MHTNGPWEIGYNGGILGPNFDGSACKPVIAMMPVWFPDKRNQGHVTQDAQEDNARLIAAAPDLLAACKDALFVFENMTSFDWSRGGDKKVREIVRAAIARAEGR
jgi:hypothetical protein